MGIAKHDKAKRDNRNAAVITAFMLRNGFVGSKTIRIRQKEADDTKSILSRCWVRDMEQGGLLKDDVCMEPECGM